MSTVYFCYCLKKLTQPVDSFRVNGKAELPGFRTDSHYHPLEMGVLALGGGASFGAERVVADNREITGEGLENDEMIGSPVQKTKTGGKAPARVEEGKGSQWLLTLLSQLRYL